MCTITYKNIQFTSDCFILGNEAAYFCVYHCFGGNFSLHHQVGTEDGGIIFLTNATITYQTTRCRYTEVAMPDPFGNREIRKYTLDKTQSF
jgi:hypothetical protein